MQVNTHRLVLLPKSDAPYKRNTVILDWAHNALEPEEEDEWRRTVEAAGGFTRHKPPKLKKNTNKRSHKSKSNYASTIGSRSGSMSKEYWVKQNPNAMRYDHGTTGYNNRRAKYRDNEPTDWRKSVNRKHSRLRPDELQSPYDDHIDEVHDEETQGQKKLKIVKKKSSKSTKHVPQPPPPQRVKHHHTVRTIEERVRMKEIPVQVLEAPVEYRSPLAGARPPRQILTTPVSNAAVNGKKLHLKLGGTPKSKTPKKQLRRERKEINKLIDERVHGQETVERGIGTNDFIEEEPEIQTIETNNEKKHRLKRKASHPPMYDPMEKYQRQNLVSDRAQQMYLQTIEKRDHTAKILKKYRKLERDLETKSVKPNWSRTIDQMVQTEVYSNDMYITDETDPQYTRLRLQIEAMLRAVDVLKQEKRIINLKQRQGTQNDPKVERLEEKIVLLRQKLEKERTQRGTKRGNQLSQMKPTKKHNKKKEVKQQTQHRKYTVTVTERKLQKMFNSLDKEQTGVISEREFMEAIQLLGMYGEQKRILKDWERSDLDGNGYLDYVEFRRCILQIGDEPRVGIWNLMQMFDRMDTDRVGAVTFDQFQAACLALGFGRNEDLRTYFEEQESSSSGRIAFKDFFEILTGRLPSRSELRAVYVHGEP